MFPIWKITEKPCGLLLHPPGFDVNFFIMGIDVIYAGPVGSVFSRHHSGTQRRIFRKERFAAALGKAEENRKEDGLDEKGVFHKSVTILFRGLFCQVGEPG